MAVFFFSGVPQKEVSTMEHNKTIFERLGITYTQGEERARRSSEMENKLTHALTLLPEEQVDEVHQYLEYLFERSAEAEELFYRSGLVDGIRLSNLFHSVETDRLTV
jgi:hypothetical protein